MYEPSPSLAIPLNHVACLILESMWVNLFTGAHHVWYTFTKGGLCDFYVTLNSFKSTTAFELNEPRESTAKSSGRTVTFLFWRALKRVLGHVKRMLH